MRAFIAIELPPELQTALRELQALLAARIAPEVERMVRWTPPANLHLTLSFLGECTSAQHQALAESLRAQAAVASPFSLALAGIGCFPNVRKPSVLWLGVTGAPPSVRLALLQQGVAELAARQGFAAEARSYAPHLTLARVDGKARPGERMTLGDSVRASSVQSEISTWQRMLHVEHIVFMQSELHPQGARYSVLNRFALARGNSGQ